MELVRKNIHMDQIKCKAGTQITLEDDINITDAKPDVYQLIMEQGEIEIEEMRPVADHVHIRGKLHFEVLYLSDEDVRRPACMQGVLPFEEQVYMEGVTANDGVTVRKELEDLSVGLINSRKLSVQALLNLELFVEEIQDMEAAVEISGEDAVEVRKKTMNPAGLSIQKKDIFRVREELELPGGMPNIFDLLWQSVTFCEPEFRILDGRLNLKGELKIFLLYEGEGESRPVQWYETSVPVNGMLECSGMQEDMVGDISCRIGHKELEVKADEDGEDRKISLDIVLDLDMKIYQEQTTEVVCDVYGVTKEIEAVKGSGKWKELLLKTTGKTKVSERFKVAAGFPGIAQICFSKGQVQVGMTEVTEEGIRITGQAVIASLYTTGDGEMPLGSLKGTIPFSYLLEVPKMERGCGYHVDVAIEQLAASAFSGEEMDVKAVLVFSAIVFLQHEESVISDIKVSELNPEKLADLPGIAAYMVKEGDSLWDIGKHYYVPIQQLKEINELSSDEIKPGDKILIVKGIS